MLTIVRGALSKGVASNIVGVVAGDFAIEDVFRTREVTSKVIAVQPQVICRMEM